jgi:glutathione S-transferase
MAALMQRLAHGPYLLGERFSAADVLYATTFAMFRQSPFMPASPLLEEYVARVTARPAYARALARENG